ncbi:MAG: hypothetical protein OEM67_01340 [Thermoleophilia bacterium]|nr:hypothetical protein [Thermoleophilia bacterium]MDH3725807.1 hypothetical protein [Thermoleophilia bacterium]
MSEQAGATLAANVAGTALARLDDPSVHVASTGGRQVAALRRRDEERGSIVECIVLPVGALRVAPLMVGPFPFPDADHADGFIHETIATLEILGCEISRGADRRA